MLNQAVPEAIVSAKYVDHYLDAVENLPDEIQRFITRIRELDVKYRSFLRDVDSSYEQWANCPTSELEGNATKRNRAMMRIKTSLIAAQELGDEKLQIVQQLTDLIEGKTRQLDQDFKNLDYDKEEVKVEPVVKDNRSVSPVNTSPSSSNNPPATYALSISAPITSSVQPSSSNPSNGNNGNGGGGNNGTERGTKRARRARNDTGSGMDVDNSDSNTKPEVSLKQTQSTVQKKTSSSSSSAAAASNTINNATNSSNNANKKKRKKSGRTSNTANNSGSRDTRDDDTPPVEEAIDPDEPTYCLCDQISFGEMILCDNDLCPIEWFHFSCVSLMTKPKGKWFCPNCRGDRPNVMKPKAQFLKELERYNKEKEEKT